MSVPPRGGDGPLDILLMGLTAGLVAFPILYIGIRAMDWWIDRWMQRKPDDSEVTDP